MRLVQRYALVRERASRVLVGQDEAFELLFIALVVGGNVLLEGVPGTAKTLMTKTLALLVSGAFQRIQFTPDLMPSDIVGTNVYDVSTSQFHVRKGPVFCNVLLADEINRAPAKTQSALLEAMEERQVTIEGVRYTLPSVYLVVATQNPVEYEGTYPLPEAQLDRFIFKVLVQYGSAEVEQEVLSRYNSGPPLQQVEALGLEPALTIEDVLSLREETRHVTVEDGLMRYMGEIGRATRRSPDVILGSSVRGPLALLQASKAYAALRERDYVVPDDVKALVAPSLRHRIVLRPEAEIEGLTADDVLRRVLGALEVPR